MRIVFNGENRQVRDGLTIAALLEQLGKTGPGVAVEVNREVAPRSDHGQWVLHDGDQVEVVTLVGGG